MNKFNGEFTFKKMNEFIKQLGKALHEIPVTSLLKENELIKDIEGYEGLYSITSNGRVWSHSREVIFGNKKRTSKGKWLHTYAIKTKGMEYFRVYLRKNNIRKTYLLHRLLAQTFIANPNNYKYVSAIDGNFKNIKLDNFIWTPGFFVEKKRKIKCLTVNKIFDSVTAACKFFNLHNGGAFKKSIETGGTYGRHPISGERLKWEYVNE